MAQNIQLICAQEELGSCCVGGFLDDVVIKALDLIDDEIPLYVIGVGKLK
jgi:nitroreductase